jgi:hypothetical protein
LKSKLKTLVYGHGIRGAQDAAAPQLRNPLCIEFHETEIMSELFHQPLLLLRKSRMPSEDIHFRSIRFFVVNNISC